MALLNQNSGVFYDSEGNILRLMQSRDQIYYSKWFRNSEKNVGEIIADNVEDFKICSDGTGGLIICFLNFLNDIAIIYEKDGSRKRFCIRLGGSEILVRDLRPYVNGGRCEIIVSHSKSENRNERILSKYSIDINLMNKGEFDFTTKDIMEYYTFGPVDEIAVVVEAEDEAKILSVIEKGPESNSVILLRDNRFGYVEGIIKISMKEEIFWHDIIVKDNDIIIAFTQRKEDLFSIKFIVYNIKEHTLSKEYVVREKNACSHPVLVNYKKELWICWYENGAIYSSVIENGNAAEEAFKWKDSVRKNVLCTDFFIDNYSVRKKYDFNCRKAFVTYPDNNMTGFGRI